MTFAIGHHPAATLVRYATCLAAGAGIWLAGAGSYAFGSDGGAASPTPSAPSARVVAGDPSVRGAAPDVRGPDGTTPLMWAVYRGDIPEVKRLLKAGAKVSELDATIVNKWRDIARDTAWKDYGAKTATSGQLLKLASDVTA